MTRRILVIALLLAGAALQHDASAHHAFAAEFDEKSPVLLKDKVTKAEWINPHAWVHMTHVEPGKAPQAWMVEGGTPNTLLRRGITKQTVAIGTEVIVDGYQTKDHSLKRANGRDITFTDGRKLFMGSSGTGAPRDGADPTEGGTKPPVKKPGGF